MSFELVSLGRLLENRAAEYKDKTYLIFEERKISYDELNLKVNQMANALLRLGVKKGVRVNVHMANCPEFLYLFFGLAKIGAVMNPTNLHLTTSELSYIVNHADAEYSFTQPDLLNMIEAIRPDCPQLKKIVVTGADQSQSDVITWKDFTRDVSGVMEIEEDHSHDDIVVNMYTSGTTALPKGVMLTHRNIISAGHSWMWLAGFGPKDRTMTGFPLFHANALFFSCVGSMVHGGSLVLVEKFSLSNWMNLARKHHVNHFNFMGTGMSAMMAQPETPLDPANPVRIVHCAGGSPELIEAWSKRFRIKVIMIYNLTECALATGTPVSGPNPVKYGSIGWPAPSLPFPTQVRVVDEKGDDTKLGEIGEIIIKGPALMKGYYKDPDKTRETIKDGWLYSGDAGRCDEDGCLWYCDRIKDMVKPKGENVASVEVEGIIGSHPQVADVGVIGVMDPMTGEEIKASILLKPGQTAETVQPREIIDWCRSRLAKFKVPRFYEYRSAPLPRGIGGGKILKKEMRQEKKENPTQGCFDMRKGAWLP